MRKGLVLFLTILLLNVALWVGTNGLTQNIEPENRLYQTRILQDSVPTPSPSIEAPVFAGSGLNDLTPGSTLTTKATCVFTITINATGTPDNFNWTETGGSSGSGSAVNITGSAQTLADGFTITFGATTGHTTTDNWTVTARAQVNLYYDSTGIRTGVWSDSGTTQAYKLDGTPPYPLGLPASLMIPYHWDPGASPAATGVGSNNQVKVILQCIPFRININRVTFDITTAQAATTGSFGIYSQDGTTLLLTTGSMATTSTGATQKTLVQAVTLNPGCYYFAYTDTLTTVLFQGPGTLSGNYAAIANNDHFFAGTAANAATAGVLPSSTGAISAATIGFPYVRFN